MSEKEEEQYSAYMTFHSQLITRTALLSGFLFSAIVIILAQYPNVAQIHAQAGLFALNCALALHLYELSERTGVLMNCIRVAPKLPPLLAKRVRYERFRDILNWVVMAAVVPILFFLWNLLYLSLASAILSALTLIAGNQGRKPYRDFLREHPWIRK